MKLKKTNINSEYEELLSILRDLDYSEDDITFIERAWEYASMAHIGQERLSGDPFITHPLAVAKSLARLKLDKTTVVAGLLHDSIEDGGAKRHDIVDEFGEEVARLVDGVTKVTELRLRGSKEEEFIENLRKMFLVMAEDLRVVLLKLADRLHNMQTLSYIPANKQKANAVETLEVYAPLAQRMGIGEIKGQLEDLAFAYVYPKSYKKFKKRSERYYSEAEKQIKKMRRVLLSKLLELGIKAEVDGRKKHIYSLWRKLQRPEIDGDFGKVNDIVALRIIVGTITQCYTALGVVHNTYTPVPTLGISDFIAQPKPNGYRSIHTKVFGQNGTMVEVQIRTWVMHEQAEYGIASHWAYSEAKEKRGVKDSILEKSGVKVGKNRLNWVKELVNWQKEIVDSDEYLKAVKFDALSHRDFVFSPKGDVYDLPRGATPVDFAYAVHTDLGKHMAGAKVDGKIVSLDYVLKSGQVVEIIKSRNERTPNIDWLNFVKTTTARREINKYLRRRQEKG